MPEEELQDGPPELIFSHGGHTDIISDFNWSSHDDYLAASVSEDNMLQVWQVSASLFDDEDDDDLDDADLEDDEEEEAETSSKRQRREE